MSLNNRINRLSSTLVLMSKGQELSTPSLVELFNITKKSLKQILKSIYCYYLTTVKYFMIILQRHIKPKTFLQKTLFNADELTIIAILKNKSKDKYSDADLSLKVDVLFEKFEDTLSNRLYQKSSVEKIDNLKDEIIQIKNAIESRSIIQRACNKEDREFYLIKILNFEEYWYLIVFEQSDKKIKTFYLNTIKKIKVLNANYKFDKQIVKTFENAITAYYKLENKLMTIELFIDVTISGYFLRKPLNTTQRVIKKYKDGSPELEIIITDLMEIIPAIQRYMLYAGRIAPDELKIEVKNNLETYFKRF